MAYKCVIQRKNYGHDKYSKATETENLSSVESVAGDTGTVDQ